ncbi:MAG: sulfide/dihydroorotate dehydrogenase-like FAD/NAD-binding protein [Deltaproteobacteria bacterium]|nr:sulfide/dihydroorotate dehydrogenase-like FAD/NAD-binding protein [Deltaproteobacteria bacterium]MBW2661799.1 sulfide/dihydroorotate dehydrogenase-like FAD/NAD-binding protein [Deltaproteobacteria bacterium]
MYKVVRRDEIVPNVHIIEIEAPGIAEKARPGQFVLIIPDETGERVPFTISDWNVEKGTITIFFLEVGISTAKMACIKSGGALYSVSGPLGNPTSIEKYGSVVCGGGCYGIGAIYPIARAMKKAGNKVTTIIEARSAYLIYLEERLKEVSDKVLVGTTDGSRGSKGMVPDVLTELMQNGEKIDRSYFVGCTFMMMNCSNVTKPYNIKTLVALNPIMVDGTGMCGCCRVRVGGKTKFACVDGPEFDGHQVNWEKLFKRNSSYLENEAMAYQNFRCQESCSRVVK